MNSCIIEENLKPVLPYHMLHGGSVKVWQINEEIKSGVPMKISLNDQKLTWLFYEDLDVFEQKKVLLGSHKAKKGSYEIFYNDQGEIFLNLSFPKESKQQFQVIKIMDNQLRLKNLDEDLILNLSTLSKPY